MRFIWVLCCIVLVGCYLGSSSSASNTSDGGAAVMFHEDVEPILQQHCQSCHVSGGIAPFPLTTYSDAVANGPGIVSDTAARIMPPWGAANTATCTTRSGFKEDPSLTDAQIATLASWVNQGMAEGNPADAPPPITPPAPGLMNPSIDLAPPAPGYALPPGETDDQFMCFVLDPQITSTTYLDASDIVPDNTLIVHHALVFADPARASLGLITDPTERSYPCFAGPNLPNTSLVAAWVPGAMPQQFPSGISMPLQPNTLLVMQIHYHPHSTDPRTSNPDVTHFQMHYTATLPQYQAVNKLIGNFPSPPELQPGPTFLIPADTSNVTETMVYTVPQAVVGSGTANIYSIGGHMHLVGQDIQITLDRAHPTQANPANECLLEIPAWSFDWQRIYAYDLPDVSSLPSVAAGDTLRVRCTYNNTLSNAQLAEELTAQGIDQTSPVTLGESTLDEMCLAIVTLVAPAK